jgi:hypothetical protein
VSQSGVAGVGVLARDSNGKIVVTAWHVLSRCEVQLKQKRWLAWRVFGL